MLPRDARAGRRPCRYIIHNTYFVEVGPSKVSKCRWTCYSRSNHMATNPPPTVFLSVPSAPIQAWPAWKNSFLWFLRASNLKNEKSRRKKHILLSLLGAFGKKLRDTIQRPGEPVSDYLAGLQYRASFCVCDPALEDGVAQLFMEGLDCKRVQDSILRECVGYTVPKLDRIASLT